MTRSLFPALLAIMTWLLAAGTGHAAEAKVLKFAFPADCHLGRTCWIANYFDNDPGPEVRDFACGPRGYDGHDGTDIAIRDLAVMTYGVRVLAAAPGVVRAVRDGMADVGITKTGRDKVKGRECGNGAIIDHAGGWSTQYCHLRRGSLAVKPGDQVKTGQEVGLIGLSGLTEFPHVEFAVRYKGRKVDPFVGLARSRTCGLGAAPLWAGQALGALEYHPLVIYNTGFAGGAPKVEEVRRGQHHDPVLPVDSPALVFWVEMFGVRAGDELVLRIVAPDGTELVANRRLLEKTQARRFQFVGKRRRDATWAVGRYRGEVVVVRGATGKRQEFHREDKVEVR